MIINRLHCLLFLNSDQWKSIRTTLLRRMIQIIYRDELEYKRDELENTRSHSKSTESAVNEGEIQFHQILQTTQSTRSKRKHSHSKNHKSRALSHIHPSSEPFNEMIPLSSIQFTDSEVFKFLQPILIFYYLINSIHSLFHSPPFELDQSINQLSTLMSSKFYHLIYVVGQIIIINRQ